MTGPGLVTIPIIAQSAGWLPTVLGFMVVGLLSALSSLFICEAMTEVPGNEYFQSNVEFSNLVLCFFGRRSHLFVQMICFLAMQTTNIASIAVSAQLFDNLLIQIFHRTCGIQIHPTAAFICVTEQLPSASPFTGVMIMSTGVVLALCMIVPLGMLKLSENIWVQLASFILILLIVLQWIVTFCMQGLDTTLVPAVGSDVSQTFGTVLFNYAFITTVPSWANAKQPNVSIHKTVGWGVGITTVIYILIAILGGMAYEIPSNSSLIQAISSSPDVTLLSQITGYTFPIAALITSIPINVIVIRYNLIQSGACNMTWANILAGILPWLVAIPCMTGSNLTTIINWSSLILVSAANFIIPFVLYIYSKRHRERLNKLPIIELEQQARLSKELSRSNSIHSRRNTNTSISGSIRRRLTGSSNHLRSQSHPEVTIGSVAGIAAATVIPLTVGIGSGSLAHHSSEESLTGGKQDVYYQYQSHPNESGEHLSGPYFSFSRDGELHEREPPTVNISELPGSRMQSSSHRISGVATVVLHDPGTEPAHKKAPLPRRVSHKDKLLSMISDKHKRAMEQQAKRQQEEQTEKPVPPMILLSQSTAPEPEENPNSVMDTEIYSHRNDSNVSETFSEKSDNSHTKDIAEANANLSNAIKRVSSTVPPQLNLSPSSPQSPRSPWSPSSPQKSNLKWSPSSSPMHLSPRADMLPVGTMSGSSLQLPHTSHVLDSAANIPSLDRRVSFTDENCQLSSGLELERRSSFSSESKRVFKAAVATLSGGSPIRPKSGSDLSHNTVDEVEFEDHLEAENNEEGSEGVEAHKNGRIDNELDTRPNPLARVEDVRRDSLGRMAAAFVSQPGSFSIKTTTLSLPTSSLKNDNRLQPNQQNWEAGISLSPSGPPAFQLEQAPSGRHNDRSPSAQSVRESVQRNQLAVPGSANSPNFHLIPPSPQQKSPYLASSENKDSMLTPTSSAPPSPLKSLKQRSSVGGGHGSRLSGSKTLAAPFQSGNNYSIPGFGSGHHSPSSPSNPLPSPGYYGQDPPLSAQSTGSMWFNRRSREPNRSSLGGMPSSPHPSMLDAMGVGARTNDPSRQDFPMTPRSEVTDIFDPEKRSSFYALENGTAFDVMWSLRAIPTWVPFSSIKIAWGSLGILAAAITATIVYDFVQLGMGNDVMAD
ncbi:hypothetical protein BGZ46_002840 [Entomortierella lignicola]|nr:hypothetical protein BGZ46_002840 [Entomortierella lignicola]